MGLLGKIVSSAVTGITEDLEHDCTERDQRRYAQMRATSRLNEYEDLVAQMRDRLLSCDGDAWHLRRIVASAEQQLARVRRALSDEVAAARGSLLFDATDAADAHHARVELDDLAQRYRQILPSLLEDHESDEDRDQ